MYFKYRRNILTVLIIIVLAVDFFIGKRVGISSEKSKLNQVSASTSTKSSSSTQQALNKNYNQEIDINGTNYSAGITVNNASIVSDGELKITITESSNNNVIGYKVMAFGANNNALSLDQLQTSTGDSSKSFDYQIKFDNSIDKNIKIRVYPLTQDMKSDSKIGLDTAAFGEVDLNIAKIKQDTIDQINGGGSSGN